MFPFLEHLNDENFKLFNENTENMNIESFTTPIDISKDDINFFQFKFFNLLSDLSRQLKNSRKFKTKL
jgi:hypothetical protein